MEPGSPRKTVPVDKGIGESRSPENMGHVQGSEVDYAPNENAFQMKTHYKDLMGSWHIKQITFK
jgi:hypothetical protein